VFAAAFGSNDITMASTGGLAPRHSEDERAGRGIRNRPSRCSADNACCEMQKLTPPKAHGVALSSDFRTDAPVQVRRCAGGKGAGISRPKKRSLMLS
jgi:hypothetical protein